MAWTWAQIILAVLKFLNWAIQYGQEQKWIAEGEARAVAKALAEITRKADYAKATLASVERLTDEQLDNVLRDLGDQ